MQYLRARYYNPGTAAFMTEDSYLGDFTDPLTLNRYNYVKSSPLNYIDPSGHRTFWEHRERVEYFLPNAGEIEKMVREGTYEEYITQYSYLLQQQRAYDDFREFINDESGSMSGKQLMEIMQQTKELNNEYIGECGSEFYDLLMSVNWGKLGRITLGTLQVVGSAIIIFAGLSALAVSGGALGTAAAALLAGEAVSLTGIAATIGTFLATLGSMIMGSTDFLEGAGNIINALNNNPERAEHLIKDKVQLFQEHPAYYYVLEGALTFGSQLGSKLLSNGKFSPIKGNYKTGKDFKDIDNAKIKKQEELSPDYFDTLTNNGTISGGRSGEDAPLMSKPNSYYKTDSGHTIIYNSRGEKVLDISPERVKVWKKNINRKDPSQVNWSNYKIKDDGGQVDKTMQWIIDYFK